MRSETTGEVRAWLGDVINKVTTDIKSSFSTNTTIMVEHGLGIGISIEGSLPYIDEKKICCRRLKPALDATNVLAWRRQQPASLAVQKFIEFAKCFLSMTRHKN